MVAFFCAYDCNNRLAEKEYSIPLPLPGNWDESSATAATTTTYGWTQTQQTSKTVSSSSSLTPEVSSLFSYGLAGQLEKVVTTT
jgi:hypothetical protein